MIFDTDVLIWLLRGNAKAIKVAREAGTASVSVVSCMELLKGAKDKRELASIRRFLRRFSLLPLSADIGQRACIYVEEHALKSGMGIADALIAATASEAGQPLCTGNVKHFRGVSDLRLSVFRPT